MKGTEAKNALKEQEDFKNDENENSFDNKKNLSEELDKLNNLLKDAIIYKIGEFGSLKKLLNYN